MKLVRYCALVLLSSAPLCQATDRNKVALKGAGHAALSLGSLYLAYQTGKQGLGELVAAKGTVSELYYGKQQDHSDSKGLWGSFTDEGKGGVTLGKQTTRPLAFGVTFAALCTMAYKSAVKSYTLAKQAYEGDKAA